MADKVSGADADAQAFDDIEVPAAAQGDVVGGDGSSERRRRRRSSDEMQDKAADQIMPPGN